MKIRLSLRTLRLILPIVKWALKDIKKKKNHSVDETEQMEILQRFITVMEK